MNLSSSIRPSWIGFTIASFTTEYLSPSTSTAGGGARAAEPSFRVIRSVSGTKLFDEGGPSGVQDPRSLFYANTDKEIIVYFTWEGSPGPHHFEGLWKNPAGKIAMTSEFDYSPP